MFKATIFQTSWDINKEIRAFVTLAAQDVENKIRRFEKKPPLEKQIGGRVVGGGEGRPPPGNVFSTFPSNPAPNPLAPTPRRGGGAIPSSAGSGRCHPRSSRSWRGRRGAPPRCIRGGGSAKGRTSGLRRGVSVGGGASSPPPPRESHPPTGWRGPAEPLARHPPTAFSSSENPLHQSAFFPSAFVRSAVET